MKKLAVTLCIAATALSLAACSTAGATDGNGDQVFHEKQMK